MIVSDVISAIESQHLEHREYRLAKANMFSHASLAPLGTVILLVGPSRVGKSRVVKALIKQLVSPDGGDGKISLILARAANTDRGNCSMKQITQRLLNQLKHPIYSEGPAISASGIYFPQIRATEATLRTALEKTLEQRSTRYIVIDEAHHLTYANSATAAQRNLDSLKCLADESKTVLILVAGYEILRRGFLSGHLNGRIRLIHFPRYADTPADRREFNSCLMGLTLELPFDETDSLLDHADYFYAGTFGAVGALFTWTIAALAQMDACGETFLKVKHYQMVRHSLQLGEIIEEIEMGERLMTNRLAPNVSEMVAVSDAERINDKPRSKPFTRKPKRYPVLRP